MHLDGDVPEEPQFDTITPPKGKMGLARLQWLTRKILDVADPTGYQYKCFTVIEGFSYGSRGSFSREIAGLGYLVRMAFYERSMPFVVVPPSTLKKFVTGKGNSQKSMMLREVYRRWGIAVNDDNEADAVGLAQIGVALLYHPVTLTAFQRDVLAKLRQDPDVQATLGQFEAHA